MIKGQGWLYVGGNRGVLFGTLKNPAMLAAIERKESEAEPKVFFSWGKKPRSNFDTGNTGNNEMDFHLCQIEKNDLESNFPKRTVKAFQLIKEFIFRG